jgi:methylated-DNA-[protein]-cysteine S-methyltransferase
MEKFSYCLFDTPLGACGLVWKDSETTEDMPVVTFLQLPEATAKLTEERISGMGDRAGSPPPSITGIAEKIRRHLGGEIQDFSTIAVDFDGMGSFSRQVYEACRKIPAGRTISYGELAKTINRPGAARAVGQALARNRIPLIIPCHRILAVTGKAGGFSAPGGVETKARILALEGVILKEKRD